MSILWHMLLHMSYINVAIANIFHPMWGFLARDLLKKFASSKQFILDRFAVAYLMSYVKKF